MFPHFLLIKAYPITTNEDDLTREKARIKEVLKENRYQGRIISKIFKRIPNNHNLSQSQQQTQATDIREEEIKMRINLPYIQCTNENYGVYS